MFGILTVCDIQPQGFGGRLPGNDSLRRRESMQINKSLLASGFLAKQQRKKRTFQGCISLFESINSSRRAFEYRSIFLVLVRCIN
jgi:hypothetical protein